MGGSASSVGDSRFNSSTNEQDIIRLMMPIWYISDVCLQENDITLGNHSWKLIINDASLLYKYDLNNIEF